MNYNRKTIFALLFVIPLALSGCFKDPDDSTNGSSSSDPSNPSGGLMSGLMAYYSFDNENGHDGTENEYNGNFLFKDVVKFADGQKGRCVKLNGNEEQRFYIPVNFFKNRTYWTVSLWVKRIDVGRLFGAVGNTNNYFTNSGDVPDFEAGQNGALGIKFAQINDMSLQPINYTELAYNYIMGNETWHHFTVILDGVNKGANVKFYVDGSLADSKTAYYDQTAINSCTATVFGGNGASFWLDEVRIFNRALSASEVKQLYKHDQ